MIINQELINEIFMLIIQVIITVTGTFLVNYLKTKISSERLNFYYNIAKTIVAAAEQTIGSGNGVAKKELCCKTLQEISNNKLTQQEIDRLIEAAVHEMNTLLKVNGLKN